MGRVIMVSFTKVMRRRSPYFRRSVYVREFDAVERPRKLLHVTGQMKLDGTDLPGGRQGLESAFQVGVSEHSTTIVPQAYARIT